MVRHPRDQATQFSPRFSRPQVLEKSKKNLLDDLFSVVHRQAQRAHVTQEWFVELLKEIDDLRFTLRGLNGRLPAGADCERQLVDRTSRRNQHESSYIYSFPPPSVQGFLHYSSKNTEQNDGKRNNQAKE